MYTGGIGGEDGKSIRVSGILKGAKLPFRVMKFQAEGRSDLC